MSKELLQKVIDSGAADEPLHEFFNDVSASYRELDEPLDTDHDQFSEPRLLGEISFSNVDKLAIVTARVTSPLSERSGKKAQYEFARKLLKQFNRYDGGIFIFKGDKRQFRFSLVYTQYQGPKRDFSNFRRFTYYVAPDQTSKTFWERVGQGNYANLETIKDAFSVEKVNKEFYKQIAQFYYRLTGRDGKPCELELPDNGIGNSKFVEEFSVRLIGRIIFCWFLKHKRSAAEIPLIPKDILSTQAVGDQYYHTTLERLFFEVMNTPIADRKRDLVGFIAKHWEMPFLNGGLFEPHTNDYYNGSANWALKIDDKWFKDFYGLLEQYNFTIDENSTVDAEVSVDPEMMGRIFENLLAEVNPETGETARKATGSYYTPRVIVDYMVEESLKQYLLTKTDLSEDSIKDLLSYETQLEGWTATDKEIVVRSLKEIKILDPACGSGAYPLGILHRMIIALEKVDPELTIWRKDFFKGLDGVVQKTVEKNISKSNWAYIRKLMIIRDSIYGVDIQPIAVEIAKLRCFLSLIVDEIVVDNEVNRGIEALPNLEFKFVAANSLVGIPPMINRQTGLRPMETEIKDEDPVVLLKNIRDAYLRSYGHEKKKLEHDFLAMRTKMIEQNINWGGKDSTALQIASWNPFSYEASKWFEPEWMFGMSSGFDVVIANPPYVFARNSRLKGITEENKKYFYANYKLAEYQVNLYPLFIEKGANLLKNDGCLCFVTPNNWLTINTNSALRKYVLSQSDVKIVNFYSRVFESAEVDSSIIIFRKANDNQRVSLFEFTDTFNLITNTDSSYFLSRKDYIINIELFKNNNAAKLIDKIDGLSIPLDQVTDVRAGLKAYEVGKGRPPQTEAMKQKRIYHSTNRINHNYIKYIDGKDVSRYLVTWGGEFLKYGENLAAPRNDFSLYSTKRILVRQIPSKPPYCIKGCLVEEILLNDLNSMNIINIKESPECILGILNSKLTSFWFVHKFGKMQRNTFPQFKINELANFPLPMKRHEKQSEISELVNQIMVGKKANPDADLTRLDQEIDRLVYELYDLTDEEVAVVEGSNQAHLLAELP